MKENGRTSPRASRRSTREADPDDYEWARYSDADLLALRLCDLGVTLEGSRIAPLIEQVHGELAARGLRVKPHYWISEEWFSPDEVPGFAVPFYLAHPRLIRLEKAQMLEAEGASRASCLQLIRHEIGHAVQHAYRLQRRRRWHSLFGRSSDPYPDLYRPNPASQDYVLHLDYWYAQAHPDEDFAETFAVWLTPGSRWRSRYASWPALHKLRYVDELMKEVAQQRPPVRSRARPEHLPHLRHTLGEYYRQKRERFDGVESHVYDADLRRLFPEPNANRGQSAAGLLRRVRARIRRQVARCTGRHEYAIDLVLREMARRCTQLKLRASAPEEQVMSDLAVLVAARSVEYVYRRREWHAM